MHNSCEFIGHLGADPEVRTAPSGDKIVNLRLAVTESWKDKNSGEWRESTEWVPVSIFNQALAAKAERSLKKGSKIFVQGAWKSRKWTDKDGNERYVTELVLQNFTGKLLSLDPRQNGDAQAEPRPQQSRQAPASRSPAGRSTNKFPGRESHTGWGDEPLDDDISFN